MFRRLRWRIAVPYVLLILVAALGLTVYISNQVRQAQLANLEGHLLADARVLAGNVSPLLQTHTDSATLDALARDWAGRLDARVTIIGADGIVLGESHENRQQMDNHLLRPEVQRALNAGQGSSTRYSTTLAQQMMYAAVPIEQAAGPALGVMRVALPLADIEGSIGRLRHSIVVAGLGMALAAALLAVLVAGRTTRPVRDLTRVAERMASGDLDARLFVFTRDEVGQLTQAFNHMADQMREQVTSLAEQQARLAAVLEHMADGVLITDESGQVQLINAAAARMLDTTVERALGRSFAQVASYHDLIGLWNACRDVNEEQIETVEDSRQDLFFQAIITPFVESGGDGYLMILQDLTQVRRLETTRRDFISNISHELRTPLAGLRAVVDTLRGGAIKDRSATKRFLKRMDVEVDAMTQMVEELLELSRIEAGRAPLRLQPTLLAEVLAAPVDRLRPQAERAGLELILHPPTEQTIQADVQQLRVVLTNLLHNAIKFTPPGGQIEVAANLSAGEVVISVQDTGVGIGAEDLPRVFERFYKADRARSGGGTGLGLAIAKHIIQGHGGRIWAESAVDQGSTFHFSLPLAEE